MTDIRINNKEFKNINLNKSILSVDSNGSYSNYNFPQNVMPSTIYENKYNRLSNALPLTCPDKYQLTPDIPTAKDDLSSDKVVKTGMPICVNDSGDKCVPDFFDFDLYLGNPEMYKYRFGKCINNNNIKFNNTDSNCKSIKNAKNICDDNNKCYGFITQENSKGLKCKYISNPVLNGSEKNFTKDLSNYQIIDGTKYNTYIKNNPEYVNPPNNVDVISGTKLNEQFNFYNNKKVYEHLIFLFIFIFIIIFIIS